MLRRPHIPEFKVLFNNESNVACFRHVKFCGVLRKGDSQQLEMKKEVHIE